MPISLDPNFLNLITQIMGGVSGKVNNAVLGTPMPTQATPQSDALTDLSQKRAQAGQQALSGVLSGPSAVALAAPDAPKKPQSALSPLQQVEVGSDRGTVAGVLAQVSDEAPLQPVANPTDQRLAAGAQMSPMESAMQPAAATPGILERLFDSSKTGVSPAEHLLRGLGAAGSADPLKVMQSFAAQDMEREQLRSKQTAANKPKVTHLPGTPFFSVTLPNGAVQIMDNEQLRSHYSQERDNKLTDKVDAMVAQARLNNETKLFGQEVKDASAAEGDLKTAMSHLDAIKVARETLPRMGTADQIKGGAGVAGSVVASFTSPQMNIDDQRRKAVRVMDWVSSSADLKGALSNVEGVKLDMPLPGPTAGRDEWSAYLDNAERTTQAAAAYYRQRAAKGSQSAQGGAAPQAPQATSKAGGMAVPGLSERASKYFN